MSKDDLMPCPFCGADAIVEKVGGYPHGYDVHCINDDCHCSLIYHETHHHAVKAWNTRTHNIQSYILGEQDAAEGLANLFEHYGYERAAKDIREEAAKWLTQENREIVSGRYRAEVPVTDHKYNIGELKANIRTHIPDFDMATQIMGVLSAKEPQPIEGLDEAIESEFIYDIRFGQRHIKECILQAARAYRDLCKGG